MALTNDEIKQRMIDLILVPKGHDSGDGDIGTSMESILFMEKSQSRDTAAKTIINDTYTDDTILPKYILIPVEVEIRDSDSADQQAKINKNPLEISQRRSGSKSYIDIKYKLLSREEENEVTVPITL